MPSDTTVVSAEWRHPICRACWVLTHQGRPPAPVTTAARRCCFCEALQTDGLELRADPSRMPCRGQHETTKGVRT